MGIEPTHSHLWCDALPIELPRPWEQHGGEDRVLVQLHTDLTQQLVSVLSPHVVVCSDSDGSGREWRQCSSGRADNKAGTSTFTQKRGRIVYKRHKLEYNINITSMIKETCIHKF